MKRILLSFILVLAALTAGAFGYTHQTFRNGATYYIYNTYQCKFLAFEGDRMVLTRTAPEAFTLDGTMAKFRLRRQDGTYLQDKGTDASFYGTLTSGEMTMRLNGSSPYRYLSYIAGDTVRIDKVTAMRNGWKFVNPDHFRSVQKNSFTVASLNVDGMPKSIKIAGVYTINLNPDAKEGPGATAIGRKLRYMGYDVVAVSEDFNYHSQIWDECWNGGVDNENGFSYNATKHRGTINANNLASALTNYLAKKPLFDTDGLCLFYRMSSVDPEALAASETWTPWNDHYGYTDSGADGLIKKGYRHYIVTLKSGVQFELYTLHMDAETSDQDNAARENQIRQLLAAIQNGATNLPVIVMGDTNCRYTRDRLKTEFIDKLNADKRFSVIDPWIEYGRGGVYPNFGDNALMASELGYRKGEVVDKVFIINNTDSRYQFTAMDYCQDLSFVNEQGEPLADHWPCVVTVTCLDRYYDVNGDGKLTVDDVHLAARKISDGTLKWSMTDLIHLIQSLQD